MALSPQWLDELRNRISLSGLLRRDVKLQRAGNEWKACCPFHNEKTPSFYVNDAKGFYHCFGCEAHGDAISWLTENKGLAFMDAVKQLALEAGMDVPAPDPAFAARAERREQERVGLGEVMAAAQDWFAANLAAPAGAAARDYLKSRGFDQAAARQFGFGFAPDDRQAMKAALGRFDEPLLVEAGLRIAPGDNEHYDRFRGRLMLPIHDARERIIAFGGRILEAHSKAPKYLNSPDTALFDKGRTLFNLHRAGPAARKAGRVVAVEGYMDVVALALAGIAESVAPMGTALTEQQLALLWRLADKPILCFDGDEAGRRAAMRAVARALPLLQPGRSLQIVQLPAGLDPDDLIRQRGRAAMEQALAEPVSMLDLVWQHERDALPLASPEDKAGLKARLIAHVDTIADSDIRALYRRDLLDRFSALAFPKREWKPRPSSGNGRPPWKQGPAPMAPQTAERLRKAASGQSRETLAQAVLAGLARHPDQISRHAETLMRLAQAQPRTLQAIDILLEHAESLEAGMQLPISLGDVFAPPPDNNRFTFLAEGHDPDDAREDLAEAVTLLVERPALEAAIKAATARFEYDPEGAFTEQQRLRKRKLAIETRLGQMARNRAADTTSANNASNEE